MTKTRRARILWVGVILSLGWLDRATGAEPSAQGPLLEKVDDCGILSLPVRGFEKLSLNDKLLAYHLYQAAVAGRNITYAQNHRYNLPIKNLCEEILLHADGIDQAIAKDIAHYLKLIYLNAGIHSAETYAKFVPPKSLTFEKLQGAAAIAAKNGAKLAMPMGKPLAAFLQELEPIVFDPKIDPYDVTRSPKRGEDMLTGSAITFYEKGLTVDDLASFKDQYPINSTVGREAGQLKEFVWRTGDSRKNVPPGLYAEELLAVSAELEKAIPYATSDNAKALQALLDFYRTGDNATFRDYNVAWLKYNHPVVDTINGFIEIYRDPMEKKGSWEGLVFFVSAATSGWLREVADKAAYYENRLPIAQEYKRKGVNPTANMVELLVATGDGGPIPFIGVNLPNDQAVRQEHGSKNELIWNYKTAIDEVLEECLFREFFLPEDQELLIKYRAPIAEILVGFHESLGHASGQSSPRLKKDPSFYLPGYYSWLEEERADLAALQHAWDPVTFKIRKDWSEEGAKAMFKCYVASQLWGIARLEEGTEKLEEAHMVGLNFAVNYLIKEARVVDVVRKKSAAETKTFYVVKDEAIPRMREAVAGLLRDLQRIKSEGDLEAIKKMAADYSATEVDPKLLSEMRARVKALHLPTRYACVFPSLRLAAKNGKPTDVLISFPTDFLRQQMGWSGYTTEDLKRLPAGL